MSTKFSKSKKYKCLKCGRPISHKGNCLPCNTKAKREREKKKKEKQSYSKRVSRKKYGTFKDERGYDRDYPKHSNLLHRKNAYKYIYLKNKWKYSLPFSAYDVHHIDHNKNNNHSSNLKIVTRDEHKKIHEQDKIREHLKTLRPWERKKWVADNYGDFSSIRLLFIFNLDLGDKIIKLLKLLGKVGIVLSIVVYVIGLMINKSLNLIGVPLFVIGVLAILFLILLSLIGTIFNILGNVFDEGKQIFEK
ncbi:MAG: HNH endonuclease [Promethearchaeota archaeon]